MRQEMLTARLTTPKVGPGCAIRGTCKVRLDKFMLTRGTTINDPKSMSGAHGTFTSGHILENSIEDYDLYLLGEAVYIVREDNIAVVLPSGTAYIRGPEAARRAADLLKKFPRPEKTPPTSDR